MKLLVWVFSWIGGFLGILVVGFHLFPAYSGVGNYILGLGFGIVDSLRWFWFWVLEFCCLGCMKQKFAWNWWFGCIFLSRGGLPKFSELSVLILRSACSGVTFGCFGVLWICCFVRFCGDFGIWCLSWGVWGWYKTDFLPIWVFWANFFVWGGFVVCVILWFWFCF